MCCKLKVISPKRKLLLSTEQKFFRASQVSIKHHSEAHLQSLEAKHMDLIPLRNNDHKGRNGRIVPYQHPDQHRPLASNLQHCSSLALAPYMNSLLFEGKRNLYQVNTVFKINACMCVRDAYMYVYVHRMMASCPQKSEQGVMYPGTEVTGNCKVPCECWKLYLSPWRAANALNYCAFSPSLGR